MQVSKDEEVSREQSEKWEGRALGTMCAYNRGTQGTFTDQKRFQIACSRQAKRSKQDGGAFTRVCFHTRTTTLTAL